MQLPRLLIAASLLGAGCTNADIEPAPQEAAADHSSFRCATEEGAALIGLEEVTLCGSDVTLRGERGIDVFSNEYIHISGKAFVQGNLIMPEGGEFDVSGNSLKSDSLMQYLGERIVAPPQTAQAAQAAQVNDNSAIDGKFRNGTELKVNSGTAQIPAGVYWFSKISVAGNAKLELGGDVRIYVDGGVSFSGTTKTNRGGDFKLELISVSSSRLKLSGTTEARLFVSAPLATVKISGNTTFRGTVLARVITVSGNVTVEALGDASNYDADSCEPEPEPEVEATCGDEGDDGDDLPNADAGPHQPDDPDRPDSDPL